MERGGDAAVRTAARFFMKDDPVHQTLRTIAEDLWTAVKESPPEE